MLREAVVGAFKQRRLARSVGGFTMTRKGPEETQHKEGRPRNPQGNQRSQEAAVGSADSCVDHMVPSGECAAKRGIEKTGSGNPLSKM